MQRAAELKHRAEHRAPDCQRALGQHARRTRRMSQPAEETRFEAQRERILKAAARCFNEKGYSGTSLKDVARHLGLTDAALYYYVRNKEELVYQCYLRAAELGSEALSRAIDDGSNGFEQAELYIRYHVEIIVGERGPVAIMSEIPSLKLEHRDEILALSRRHSLAFEAILSRGISDGSITACDVRMTGNAIMGSINWIPKWFHGSSAVADEIIRKFPDVLTRGLRSR
jgi:TetR/AcrR family transcriptional regulator, cholesterol catabolism regulator